MLNVRCLAELPVKILAVPSSLAVPLSTKSCPPRGLPGSPQSHGGVFSGAVFTQPCPLSELPGSPQSHGGVFSGAARRSDWTPLPPTAPSGAAAQSSHL